MHRHPIPKILHQIWLGTLPPPLVWLDTWKHAHPKWEFRLWTVDNMPKLRNQKQFDAAMGCDRKSEILSAEILEQYGGVYVHAYSECLQPLDDLLRHQFFAAYDDEAERPGVIADGVIGCVPHHPVLVGLVDAIREYEEVSVQKTSMTAIPFLFSQVIKEYEIGHGDVTILPSYTFYPQSFLGNRYNGCGKVYVKQHWQGEWPSDPYNPKQLLKALYTCACETATSTCEHLPVFRKLAMECSSVVEIGIRRIVSTWGILQGLSENPSPSRSYLGIDIAHPPPELFTIAKLLANDHGITFTFWEKNDMEIDIPPAEFLFIDSLHTYCHLTYELEKFSSKISKYIALHDTSEPWGECDEDIYTGDYSEYPKTIDRSKRGLWAAVEDFLAAHPDWVLHERLYNSHGLTILKREKM